MEVEHQSTEDPLVDISVSGTCFTVRKAMLLEHDWMLSRIVNSSIPWALYHKGCYFIDQDPIAFRWILHFTRCQSLPVGILSSETELEAILSLADYLCFKALLDYIEDRGKFGRSQLEQLEQLKAGPVKEIEAVFRFHAINHLQNSHAIIVEGAGTPEVNGMYHPNGYHEGFNKYSMEGIFKGECCVFNIFRCKVSDDTYPWYISIVPPNGEPGKNTDIDFYSAPVLDDCVEYPPIGTWTKSNEGRLPPPKLVFRRTRS